MNHRRGKFMNIPGRICRPLACTCLASALCTVMAFGPANAWADMPWMLHAPSQPQVQASATLRVSIPTGLTPLQLAALAVEVDNIDVTALAGIDDGAISYTPPSPLAPGRHVLQVVEYTSSGQQIAHGSWNFQVAPPSAPVPLPPTQTEPSTTRSASVVDASVPYGSSPTASMPPALQKADMPATPTHLAGSVDASANVRMAQSELASPAPKRVNLSGNLDISLTHPVATWTATGTLAGLYSSNTGTALTGQGFQPSEMNLTIARGQDKVVLGDQVLAYNNLLVSGLARRGASASAAWSGGRTAAGAFALRSSAMAGFYGGLGVSNVSDRLVGAILQTSPFTDNPQALILTVGFVSGSSPTNTMAAVPPLGLAGSLMPTPLGVFGSTSPPGATVTPGMPRQLALQAGSGNAWMAGFATQALGGKLQLHAQYAGSSFEFPAALGASNVRAHDHASDLEADFNTPLPDLWTLGAQLGDQRVGTYFRSLANPALAPDQWMLTGVATVSGHSLTMGVNASQTEDNTDDNPAIATVQTRPWGLSASYGPMLPPSVTRWLGTPSLNTSWQSARTSTIALPFGAQSDANRITNGSATLNFIHPHWSWQAGVTNGSFTDLTGLQDNTHNQGPTLGLNVNVGTSLTLGLNAQYLDTHDLKTGSHQRDRNYAFTASDASFGGRVTTQLSFSINHNVQQQISGLLPSLIPAANSTVLKTVASQLQWIVLPATASRGGLNLGLSLAWNDSTGFNAAALTQHGYGALTSRGYQVLLTVSSSWPLDWKGL